MDEEELISFLRDKLNISCDTEKDYDGSESVTIEIKLGSEVISSDRIYFPSTNDDWC